MSKPHAWVVLNPDGSVFTQAWIAGTAKPSETGDNPDGLREFKISRHGDLTHERYDTKRKRWVSERARKGAAECQAHLAAMNRDQFAEHIAAPLRAQIDALSARVAALEEGRE